MISLLKKSQVIVCMGTGGVGKTTISAALGVLAAQNGIRTLVLTIDPAKRLAQALGIANSPGEDIPVPGVSGLFACMIDPRMEFDLFVRGSVENRIAEGLFKNPLYQQLVGNLSGSQEFTSLVRVDRSIKSNLYDLIILDTPPVQNSVDFIKAPERIYSLFQESVIRWFAPKEKATMFTRLVNRGTSMVTMALEKVTGGQFISELRDFFSYLSYLQVRVAQTSQDLEKLLHSDKTGIVLVTGYDQTKLKEALELKMELQALQLNLQAVIVNRAFPMWSTASAAAAPTELVQLYQKMAVFFEDRIAAYDEFARQIGEDIPILRMPDYNQAVLGVPELSQVAGQLQEKFLKC